MSPSSRGRGSKLVIGRLQERWVGRPLHEGVDRNGHHRRGHADDYDVALFTRAWIETPRTRLAGWCALVALFTRAWIETASLARSPAYGPSPSSRGRGSKRALYAHAVQYGASPSSRGRGSKRAVGASLPRARRSPSSRGRGSKRHRLLPGRAGIASPSSRGRGSKLSAPAPIIISQRVALLTRAWIETWGYLSFAAAHGRRPLHEGVDRNNSAER